MSNGDILLYGEMKDMITEITDSSFTVTNDYNFSAIRFTGPTQPSKLVLPSTKLDNVSKVRVYGPHTVHAKNLDVAGMCRVVDKEVQIYGNSISTYIQSYDNPNYWQLLERPSNYFGKASMANNGEVLVLKLETIFCPEQILIAKTKDPFMDPKKEGVFWYTLRSAEVEKFFPQSTSVNSLPNSKPTWGSFRTTKCILYVGIDESNGRQMVHIEWGDISNQELTGNHYLDCFCYIM